MKVMTKTKGNYKFGSRILNVHCNTYHNWRIMLLKENLSSIE